MHGALLPLALIFQRRPSTRCSSRSPVAARFYCRVTPVPLRQR